MTKASESVVASEKPHNPAIAAAAAQIVALINSRPASPREDEIAAVLERALPAAGVSVPKHRAEWDRLMAASKAIGDTAGDDDAGDEEVKAATARLDDLARAIWDEPVRGPADVMLLAEVCFWAFWTEPSGLCGGNADAALAAGPSHADLTGICDEAFAALLKGIRSAFGNVS